MSCDDEARKTARCLERSTRVARGSAATGEIPRIEASGPLVSPGLTGPKTLPLEIRDVSPGEGFTRLETGPREAVHTGGVWVSPDGEEFWKPLDGRPALNADVHVPTREAEVLELMAGEPGFPRNWRVEEAGEVVVGDQVYRRRWLVRPRVYPLPSEDVPLDVERHVLPIEQGLRELSRQGWGLGDSLSVAYDPEAGQPLILDLSAARLVGPATACQDNELEFHLWAEQAGLDDLVMLRKAGRKAVEWFVRHTDPNWPRVIGPGGKKIPDDRYQYVYASRMRPMSGSWAGIPGAYYKAADYEKTRVHTWVILPEPLDEETVQQYELIWAWSPWQMEE